MKKILLFITLLLGIIFSAINTELMYLCFTGSILVLTVGLLKPTEYHVYYRNRSDWKLASRKPLVGLGHEYLGKMKYHELPKNKVSII